MNFLIEVNGKIFEISELVKSVSYTDKLNDGCSKLEFSYIDDGLVIENGSIVNFSYDNSLKFFGYVFKHGSNKKKEITVTAYDQLRYAKAKDIIVSKGDTVTTLAKKMCNYLNLKSDNLINTAYTLKTNIYDDKTWLDIIYSGISETLINKGIWYLLRDEYGSIALRNLSDLTINLILGDGSLVYDFEYEKSIDDNFYNVVKLASANETTGKVDTYITKDSSSIEKYGILQYFELLDANINGAQAKSKADILLSLYNREVETLTLNCLGDTRIRAGSSFFGKIEDINLDRKLFVRSVTHDFIPVHTMTVEVAI